MNATLEQTQRWVWFIDVVFGAIVALGIQSYSPVVREAWSQGISEFAITVYVGLSLFTFVVYDIAIYHALVKKYSFSMTFPSFLRFYLDLVMAFTLYLLLANGFQAHPDWVSIITAVLFWHFAAMAWHLLARIEHKDKEKFASAVLPHVLFIAIYFIVAFFATQIRNNTFGLEETVLSTLILIIVSTTILFISLFRWNQVIREVVS